MVDFDKLLRRKKPTTILDPISIFHDLDKESGKEYLRPPQAAVLKDWHENYRNNRDVVVKLHTGQGKTLIGLLILQSSLNEGTGPALYICPNNYLVNQTIEQAREFGIRTIQFAEGVTKPPQDFINSDSILVANCKKLFNGKSVFGVIGSGREPINLGSIVMDDAHKCLELIRESFSIIVYNTDSEGKKNPIYNEMWELFNESLGRQAAGTCSDIASGETNSFMAVPFWTWHSKQKEVLEILQREKGRKELLFVWDLLKNNIEQSTCLFSGNRVEIAPRLLPIDLIPSFSQSKRRIFLSATLTEDAFLVRDLSIDSESVSQPLSSGDVPYCGERLIVIPSLVDPNVTREELVRWVSGIAKKSGRFGVAAITPSFEHAKLWSKYGATVTNVKNLEDEIIDLTNAVKKKTANQVIIIVNEYDGVDLPDSTCRILTLDSLPSYSSLMEKYAQEMRPTSGIIRKHLAQRVEQGMGRAIRGSSDWCIVVAIGNKLTDFLSEHSKRIYLSKEAQMQIKLGEELAEEMKTEGLELRVVSKLVHQVLNRNASWKEYYREKMADLERDIASTENLKRAILERNAETLYTQRNYLKAIEILEQLIQMSEQSDRGWYLQLKATYLYPVDPTRSMDLQLKAHSENNRLFRPERGIMYSKLTATGRSQASLILNWIHEHESHSSLLINLTNIMDAVTFKAPSQSFEDGIDQLGKALGFSTQQPEKDTGIGPDNLWNVAGKRYWVIECKSRVSSDRKFISKKEAGQLSNTIGWFKENYEDCSGKYILIHPAGMFAKGAYIQENVWCFDQESINSLKENMKRFYTSMQNTALDDLTIDAIKVKIDQYRLDENSISNSYLKATKKYRALAK